MSRVGKIIKSNTVKTAIACAAITASVFASSVMPVFAAGMDSVKGGLVTAGNASGLGTTSSRTLEQIVGTVINQALGLLGFLLLGYLLYGGFLWMTSGGDSKGAEKAKATITNAMIGLVIIALAYAISAFVLDALLCATTGTCNW